jgi:hypothetical protein
MDEDQRALWAFSGGIFLRVDMSRIFTFQPEILFVRKGAVWEASENWGNYHYSYKYTNNLNYLELPLLIQIIPPSKALLVPNLCFGLAPAFLLSAQYNLTGNYSYYSYSDNGTFDGIRDIDVSLIVGGGFDIKTGKGSITTEVRYTVGLVNLDKTSSESKINNRSVSFLVGYCF